MILGSMYAGITGMKNHAYSMDVISNNIANVSTVGYKSQRLTFGDAISQYLRFPSGPASGYGGSNPMQVGLGSTINSISTVFNQGTFEKTGLFSDLGIEGDGFFIVRKNDQNYFTRNGQFTIDSVGNIVNSTTGAIVQGYKATGGVIDKGAGLQGLTIPLYDKTPAKATSKISFVGNLNSSSTLGTDPTATPIVSNISIYDSQGNRHMVSLTFSKSSNNTWAWKATTSTTDTTGTTTTTEVGNGEVIFNEDGSYQSATNQNITILTTNGSNPEINVTLDFGTSGAFTGVTQTLNSNTLTGFQDGHVAGDLNNLNIDQYGKIIGSFSNGEFKTLGQIPITRFRNNQGLSRVGESLFEQTINSGDPMINTLEEGSVQRIISGSLEASTVDLTDEFAQMIITQRGYQANAKVITTSDEMTTDLIGIKR